MKSKTIEIRLRISEDELIELQESLQKSSRELSEELQESMESNDEDAAEIAERIRVNQSVRCKLDIQGLAQHMVSQEDLIFHKR